MRAFSTRLGGLLAMLQVLGGCATGHLPENRLDAQWMAQQDPFRPLAACHAGAPPEGYAADREVPAESLGGRALFLGAGDRLRLNLAGDETYVSGTYVIAADGTITLPRAGPVTVQGQDEQAARHAIQAALVGAGVARPGDGFLDLRLIESAGVSVAVGGAVFDPGQVRTGERPADAPRPQEANRFGDDNPGRTLSGALRAAGGLRPDADVRQVWVQRDGRWARVDLLALIDGTGMPDLTLRGGDRIFVPSTGCFDTRLVRPTAVTAPGVRVYMSNLTRPATSNAASAIGHDATSLPYGTRMLQGLVDMNCVGGSAMNARRSAVLISRNPINRRSIVIARSVEGLVREAGRDDWDPYLMPGDSLACYDSAMSNVQDVVSLLGTFTGLATTAVVVKSATN
jgi:polysaccharide biosynthesis/export protein